MMNLISWTGWTKEDWVAAFKAVAEFVIGFAFMFSMMFIIGYFG